MNSGVPDKPLTNEQQEALANAVAAACDELDGNGLAVVVLVGYGDGVISFGAVMIESTKAGSSALAELMEHGGKQIGEVGARLLKSELESSMR